RGRDGAVALHGTVEPVLDDEPVGADGQPAGHHLQVRHEPLRELAEARLGRRLPHHARRARAQHPGARALPPETMTRVAAMDAKVDIAITEKPKLSVRNLNFFYGSFQAL